MPDSLDTSKLLTILGIPDWARWVAVDSDGEVNLFSAKPVRDKHEKKIRWVRPTLAAKWHMMTLDCPDQKLFGTRYRIR